MKLAKCNWFWRWSRKVYRRTERRCLNKSLEVKLNMYISYILFYILQRQTADAKEELLIMNLKKTIGDKNTYTMVLNCDKSNLKQKNYFKKMKLIILNDSDYTIMHTYIDYIIMINCKGFPIIICKWDPARFNIFITSTKGETYRKSKVHDKT